VKIIGDSHLKGSAARTSQYLNTKSEVCSFIKLGACTNLIFHSQEMEFMSLGIQIHNNQSNNTYSELLRKTATVIAAV